MNKKEKIVVATLVAGVLIINGYSKSKLKDEIRSLHNEIANRNSEILSNLSGLTYNMEEFKGEIKAELENQGSILSSHSTNFEYKDGKLYINLSVVPKEFKAEETMKFIVGSEEITAVNEEGAFVGRCVTAPTDIVEARVQLISGDTIRQETLPPINIEEELVLHTNVLFMDGLYGFEEKGEEYKDTLLLSCYDPAGRINLENPKEVTLIIQEIGKGFKEENKVGEIPMENPPADIANSQKFYPLEEGASIYSADLSDLIKEQGQYWIYCDLVTESGLRYYFQVGEVTNDEYGNRTDWGTNSGVAYPTFDKSK